MPFAHICRWLRPIGFVVLCVGSVAHNAVLQAADGVPAADNSPPEILAIDLDPRPIAPGSDLRIEVTAEDLESGASGLEYRLDPGDGSGSGPWQRDVVFSHAYTEAGHYVITVQVRDGGDPVLTTTATTTATVLVAPNGPAPAASAALAADADRGVLWCVAPDNDAVARVDLATGQRQQSIALPTGSDPRAVAIDPATGRAWITCHDRDRVQLVAPDGELAGSITLPYGTRPVGIVFHPDGERAYVAGEGSATIIELDVAHLRINDRLAVGPSPHALAISGDGSRLLATRFISPDLAGEVYDIATAGLALTRVITLDRSRSEDNGSGGRGLPNYLSAIAISPDGRRAWLTAKKDNVDRGLFVGQQDLRQDQTVRAMVAVLDLDDHREIVEHRIDLDNSDSPAGVAFSPLGDYAFVTIQGNNTVVALDALAHRADGDARIVFNHATGRAPQGVAVAGGSLWTHDFLDRSVGHRAIDHFLTTGKPPAPAIHTALVDGEALAAEVLHGKRIFYNAADTRMTAESYISCATCHRDGGHDGRTWDFTGRGEGLRNTTSLHGRSGMGHGNVHWSGNFDEIQDFEHDMRGPFGGTGFMSDEDFAAADTPLGAPKAGQSADLDALAAYVASLDARSVPRSPTRPDGRLNDAADRGRSLFLSLDCATCHVPESGFRDGQRHDVGTLRASSGQRLGETLDGIDTPTLIGLHDTAPYFHNGSAATVAEVFTVTAGTEYQVEDADLGAGASAVSGGSITFAHAGGYAAVPQVGTVTVSGIDGGSGGSGSLEIRYHTGTASGLRLAITLGATSVTTDPLPGTGPESDGEPTRWTVVRVPVEVPAGNNDLELRLAAGDGSLMLDEIVIATADHVAAAHDHVGATAGLSDDERADLIAYLMSIDLGELMRRRIEMNPNPESIWTLDGTLPSEESGLEVFDDLPASADHLLDPSPESDG